MKRILVSGAGSLLGQGIIKTIKSCRDKYEIYATDYLQDSLGLYWAKKGYIMPDILKFRKNETKWLSKIIRIIKKHKINYVIPALDFELPFFSKYKNIIEKKSKCIIVVSNIEIINIFRDKWLTFKYLKNNDFLYPKTTLPSELKYFLKKNKFPLIVKPRTGSTSKNVFLVKNRIELKNALKNCKNPLIQEYLYNNNNEYTCGVIFNNKKNSCLSSIVLNRKLKNGNTIIASLTKGKKYNKIDKFITSVARKIKPFGPLNFQLCLTTKGPIIFEINPRFSGTTPLRNLFGVNEIEVLLNSLEEKEISKLICKPGIIYRYYNDFYIKKKKFFI
jgi:carbamoyl-phosphate synthase large subunit